nr:MAG TPA: hypothetical protein [Caudoviricetes sp.]
MVAEPLQFSNKEIRTMTRYNLSNHSIHSVASTGNRLPIILSSLLNRVRSAFCFVGATL